MKKKKMQVLYGQNVLPTKFWEDITTPTYQLQSGMNEVATTIIYKIKILVNTEKLSAADSRMIEWTTTEGTVNTRNF